MNDLRLERALRSGPPFATQYRMVALPLELTERSRMPTVRRLAVVGLIVLTALAGGLMVISGMVPTTPRLVGCPAPRSESEALDTFVDGVPPEERAWRAAGLGTRSSSTEPGVIAVFADELPDAPLALDTIDPRNGQRCRLVTFARSYQIGPGANVVDWSPAGDALAIGFEGQLLIWTPTRLLRIWEGNRFPRVAWSNDGSSIAVWPAFEGMDETGAPNPDVHLVFADGRAERSFALDPGQAGTMDLRWSPDGTRWAINVDTGIGVGSPTEISVVAVADGSVTALDLGLSERTYHVVGWPDDEHLIVRASIYGPEPAQYLVLPIAEPGALTTLAARDEFAQSSLWRPRFSPDLSKFLVSSSDIGVVVVDANSGERTTLVPDYGPEVIAWAPDGRQLVFQTDLGIFTIDASGSDSRPLASGSVLLIGDPWQPEMSR